ncbi:MAG: serine hydrolase domain-containing protein [Rhodospirillaceae bacterium]
MALWQSRAMRGTLKTLAVLSVVLVTPPAVAMDEAAPLDVGLSPYAVDHLDASMAALVETGRRSGIVWAVAKNGKLVTHKASGLRDIEAALPMQTDSIFRLHSMTRAVTGVAVMMMYEAGKFDLDDPVAKFIPAFANTPVLKNRKSDPTETEPQTSPLTIRHLLTYTSGIGYPFDYDPVLNVSFEKVFPRGQTIEQGVNYLASRPLLFQPGARWYYGFSGDVLGRLVEIWSGQPYDVFLRDRVFTPLGLNDMGFQLPDDQQHRLAKVYAPDDSGVLQDAAARMPPIDFYSAGDTIFSGGGGLLGTAIDYLRFSQMLLNGGVLEGVRLLQPETVALMTRNHLSPEQGPLNWYARGRFSDTDPWAKANGYGWGLSIGVRLDDQPHTIVGGQGEFRWDGFANTTFFIDPENQIVAVAMTQYLGPEADDLENALRTSLYGSVLQLPN